MAVAGIGNTYAIDALDLLLGSGTPATWYAALAQTMPTDGTGTGFLEASYTAYARQPITNNGSNFPGASVVGGIAVSACQLAFAWPIGAGISGSQVQAGVVLFDAVSGGNMGPTAVFGTPTVPVTYPLINGSTISVAAGNLSFQAQ